MGELAVVESSRFDKEYRCPFVEFFDIAANIHYARSATSVHRSGIESKRRSETIVMRACISVPAFNAMPCDAMPCHQRTVQTE